MRITASLVAAALLLLLLSTQAPAAETSSSATAPTVCDDNYSCPDGATCCCIYRQGEECFTWTCCPLQGTTCCPLQGTTCCDDSYSCCPSDYGFCDTNLGTCLMGQDSPLSVKALKRTMAKPHWAFSSGPKSTIMSESIQEFDTCDNSNQICSTL